MCLLVGTYFSAGEALSFFSFCFVSEVLCIFRIQYAMSLFDLVLVKVKKWLHEWLFWDCLRQVVGGFYRKGTKYEQRIIYPSCTCPHRRRHRRMFRKWGASPDGGLSRYRQRLHLWWCCNGNLGWGRSWNPCGFQSPLMGSASSSSVDLLEEVNPSLASAGEGLFFCPNSDMATTLISSLLSRGTQIRFKSL